MLANRKTLLPRRGALGLVRTAMPRRPRMPQELRRWKHN